MKQEERFLEIFENNLKKNWERPALSNYEVNTYLYKDLAQKIAELHLIFKEFGLQKGDKIALVGENSANWGVAFWSVLTYGAVLVPFLRDFKSDNIYHIIHHSEAKFLFIDQDIWQTLSTKKTPNILAAFLLNSFSLVKQEDFGSITYSDHNRKFREMEHPKSFEKEDVKYHRDQDDELAIIAYTTVTTGSSNGVMIPYRALLSNFLFTFKCLPSIGPESKVICMIPLALMCGMTLDLIFTSCVGAQLYFLSSKASPILVTEAFQKIKPNLIVTIPPVIERIYKKRLSPILNTPWMKTSLKIPFTARFLQKKIQEKISQSFGSEFHEMIICSGALNKETEIFFKRINFRYTIGYGMTECASISYSPGKENRLFASGRAVPGIEIRIKSRNPEKTAGEIEVRGPHVMLGYYKNEEATKNAFTEDAWFKTGDIATIDKDGFLFIRGRLKSMILGQEGDAIFPEEIESIFNSMPYVCECLVLKNTDKKLTAFIFPDFESTDAENLSIPEIEKELERYKREVNRQLPNYSQIEKIVLRTHEFEKSAKNCIKRFLYQNLED